jgi:hypothetical protein
MIRRRQFSVFSLAFLDAITCGFGAVILIFVLSIDTQEKDKLSVLADLQRAIAAQLAELAKLRSSKEDLTTQNARVTTLVTDARLRNDTIHALIADFDEKLSLEKKGQEALLVDIDDLKKEIAARQKKPEMESVLPEVKPAPVGLNISGNYIAIIIDTSGSMRDPNYGGLWPIVVRKVGEILDSYPQIEGVQLLDGDGRFIMGPRRGTGTEAWIKDSPEVRDQIVRTLRRYDQDSISNPVPGIRNALRFLYDKDNPNMKMVCYLFGDEFIDLADPAIRQLDELNPADENGHRKVVINAIGFPTTIRFTFSMGQTGVKFANLMRTVCYQHGGAFIALQDL